MEIQQINLMQNQDEELNFIYIITLFLEEIIKVIFN